MDTTETGLAPEAGNESGSEISPAEQKAREMGWTPKDEYKGDPDNWLSAEEFVSRKPLFDKLDAKNREIKSLKRDMQRMAASVKTLEAEAYDRAVRKLQEQRKAALADGDTDLADEIGEKVAEVKQAKKRAVESGDIDADAKAAVESWAAKNSWYSQDAGLRADAEHWFGVFTKANANFEMDDALEFVAKKVRQNNPEKFPSARKPVHVEGDRPASGGTPKGRGFADMPAEARNVYETLSRRGLANMSKDQYAKDYFGSAA